jgi:putative tricarboxylic transport membrane protein
MTDPKMVKKDFIASIVLIAFSLSVVVLSYTMPRLERRGIDPFSAPGVVPGMIGLVLLCLALVLFVRSIRQGGYKLFESGANDVGPPARKLSVLRVLLTLVVSLIYAVGFLGRLNYSISTALYILAFICLFEYQPGQGLWPQRKMFIAALIQAVLASVLITLVFQKLFLVDLP